MDNYAVAALAHVRILLVPIGSISKRTFDQWAAEIRTIEALRLSDIPPGTKDEKARFMPSPKSKGYIHLSYPSHPPPASHFSLSMFRPSLFPLGVIGIASCSRSDSLTSILAEFNAVMREMFPPDSVFPLARNCFIFEEDDGSTNLNLGDLLPGLVVIPSAMGNKKENIETLLADLCSNLLGEFSTIMSTLETPLGNEFLNAGMFPRMPHPSELPKPLDDAPSLLPPHNSQPELPRTKRASLMPTRTASVGPGSAPAAHRQSTLGPRKSGIGTASSHGRLFKVLGDLFLLSGRGEDASIWYTEAVALFKAHPDNAWHAAALEGLATVSILEAWLSGQSGAPAPAPGSGAPWAGMVERLEQATALYAKAAPAADGEHNNHALLAYAYCLCTARHASLLSAVWLAKGWGLQAWAIMLGPHHAPPQPHAASPAATLARERLSAQSGVPRAAIADALGAAHGPWLLHLGARERIALLQRLAAGFAALGFHRKEAYVLREVVGCVMDLLVVGRAEDAGGEGGEGGDALDLAVRRNERADGNRSVGALMRYICRLHGIDLEAVKLVDPEAAPDEAEGAADAADADEARALADPVGWPELQVGIIREALAVAEALPDPAAVAQFSFSALKSLHAVLTDDDQYTIFAAAARALTAAHRRGDPRIVEYWSGQPVVSIEMIPAPATRQVVENPVSLLAKSEPGAPGAALRAVDPFLYNPRRSITAQGKTLVVAGEPLEFAVTLTNPYVFELELQNLALSTSGAPFTAFPQHVALPPGGQHTVVLAGVPGAPGVLTVRGCVVQAPGGAPREFALPLATPEEDERAARRRSALLLERGRTKFGGLGGDAARKRSSTGVSKGGGGSGSGRRFLECKVVAEQPALRVRWSSLAHGALMLYDGERAALALTLENVGALPVDLLRLTFADDAAGPLQAALDAGTLSVFDAYEAEHALVHRPAFAWDARAHAGKVLAPGEKTVVEVACTGRLGCTSGTVSVAYGLLARPAASLAQPADVFHTRALAYPVRVTVYQTLECAALDVLPFAPAARELAGGAWAALARDAAAEPPGAWCLVVVEVRNTYGLPFEVTFERAQDGTKPASTSRVVAPGSSARILLPLRRILLPEADAAQPIPSLSGRQFVVDKSGLSSAAARAQRALFWYREALLRAVRARWREVGGGARAGELSLRRMRMTGGMMDCLRVEGVGVRITLWARADGGGDGEDAWRELPVREGAYVARAHEFVYARVGVTNNAPEARALTLDLSIDPAEHALVDGAATDVPLGRVAPGAQAHAELPLCFLACGRFALAGAVRVLGDPERAGSGAAAVRVVEE